MPYRTIQEDLVSNSALPLHQKAPCYRFPLDKGRDGHKSVEEISLGLSPKNNGARC